MDDKQLWALIGSLSLREKATLCSGIDNWQTQAIPEKGIPSLWMADGPHGLRREDRKNTRQNGGPTRRATCFPPEVTLAGAWDPELTRQVGAAIAEECLAHGVGLLLGPGVNIKRSPLGGRNFEYYSEDPLLAGELAAGFIAGVQEKGVGTSLKHFAVNNQEKYRMSIDAVVDDRALFDLYLRPFEIAVQKAQPDTVMASYNKVNGVYSTENRRLLTEILRLRFGFTGAVVSDWGAVNDRAAAIAAGMDLEMPGSGGMNDWAIERAVTSGFLSEDALDVACLNILRLVLARSRQGKPAPACDYAAHHRLAADALCKSAVLLKNDGALPLAQDGARVAVIGEMAELPRFQGGGSSLINPKQLVSFLSAMKAAGQPFVYAPGYRGTTTSTQMIQSAVLAAKKAETVVLFLGLPDLFECEGYDREQLNLPASQLALVDAVAAANPNVVAVLCCGAPVALPWLDKVRALLCLHLGGEGVGEGAVRLLYGRDNPGGKLAESWPLALEDTPAWLHFPMGPNEVSYNESLFVGYRYYDTAQKPVQFPFGYGLSYTRYTYSDLEVDRGKLAPGETLAVRLKVKNTGQRAGEEIVQLYLARLESATFQSQKELVAFCRVALAAGEEKPVAFEIPYSILGFYDTASQTRVMERGRYRLLAGPDSRELPLAAEFEAEGVVLAGRADGGDAPYKKPADNQFPDGDFAALQPLKRAGNELPTRGRYTTDTPLGLMRDSLTGRLLYGAVHLVSRAAVNFSHDRAANRRATTAIAHDLPFKNLAINSRGLLSPWVAGALLDLCNRQGGVGRVLHALAAGRPYANYKKGRR